MPNDGAKYVPFPGCQQKSISSFTGLYPFHVIELDNSMQLKAIADHLANELEFGNMYSVGNGISSWYAGMKACGFAPLEPLEIKSGLN